MGSGAVVVAGAEEGVIVAALELEARFENFGRDIDKGGSEISEKTWEYLSEVSNPLNEVEWPTCCEIGERRRNTSIYQMSFAILVGTKEYDRAWKRPQESRCHSAIEPSSETFLLEDCGIC